MAARVVSLGRRLVAPAVGRRPGLAPPARRHAWQGASGREYVHGVYSLIECPPLPVGCRRTLSLEGVNGDRTIGIAGDAAPEDWIQGFDQSYRQLGWKAGSWRVEGGTWQVRYDSPRAAEGHVEVRFHETERGRLVGLVLALPAADASIRGSP